MLSGLAAFASQVFCTSAMFSCSRSLGRELSGVFSARPCALVFVREPDTSSPGTPPTRNQSWQPNEICMFSSSGPLQMHLKKSFSPCAPFTFRRSYSVFCSHLEDETPFAWSGVRFRPLGVASFKVCLYRKTYSPRLYLHSWYARCFSSFLINIQILWGEPAYRGSGRCCLLETSSGQWRHLNSDSFGININICHIYIIWEIRS